MARFSPKFINEWLEIKREGGLKLLFKKKGWYVIVAIVTYYLIRDSILYILIPYLIYKGIF
ncbi:MAG: hypothetical protein CMF85_04685 [Candidatus Marinimicrobia bacterium]|nr:hypothetical protein [Candidatus Neomarinimicrobiota bacterium]